MLKMVQQLEREIFFALGRKQKRTGTLQFQEMLFGFVIFCIAGDFFVLVKNIEYKVNNPLKRTSKFIKPNGKIIFYSWPQKWYGSCRTNYIHLSLIYEFSRMYDASNPIKKLSLQLSAWSCILLSFKTLPTIPAALYVLQVRFILQRSHSRFLHRDLYWTVSKASVLCRHYIFWGGLALDDTQEWLPLKISEEDHSWSSITVEFRVSVSFFQAACMTYVSHMIHCWWHTWHKCFTHWLNGLSLICLIYKINDV